MGPGSGAPCRVGRTGHRTGFFSMSTPHCLRCPCSADTVGHAVPPPWVQLEWADSQPHRSVLISRWQPGTRHRTGHMSASSRCKESLTVSRRLFTSESVTEGHPDKMADQISDTILDAMLTTDPASRVAVETMITTGQVHIAGEVTTQTYVDIPALVREKILEIGYDSSAKGFDGDSCGVNVSIDAQSPDIAQGVDTAYEARVDNEEDQFDRQGAGDQGLMFGYANRESPELMPLPIKLAHSLAERLAEVRRNGTVPYLRPDGKTQVTVEYDGQTPVRLDTVVVSSQHSADISLEELLTPDVREHVIDPVITDFGLEYDDYRLLVNPTGRFAFGGPT